MYWTQRQEQLWRSLEKDEAALLRRMDVVYAREAARLEREIAAYYAKYGEGNVIRYRALMHVLDDADRSLLMERMEEFAQKYPEHADLLPVRESIYKLNRIEGLQQSVYLQQLELAGYDDAAVKEHLIKNALRGYGSAAKFTDAAFLMRDDIVRKFVGVPWADGQNFSRRIWGNRKKLAGYLNNEFGQAMARGDSYARCAKVLRERFGTGAKNTKALVYTEGSFILNESSIDAFARDYDRYAVSCARDGRVCDKCSALNGKEFRIEDRESGVNFPPFHTRCRCSYTIAEESDAPAQEELTYPRASGKVGDTDDYTIIDAIEPFDISDKNAVERELREFFDHYADAPIEHAIVMSHNGNIYRLTGIRSKVNVDLAGLDALEHGIVAHNHPVIYDFLIGDSFSRDDVKGAAKSKTREYLFSGTRVESFCYTGNLTAEKLGDAYDTLKNEILGKAADTGEPVELIQKAIMQGLSKILEGFEFHENF